MEPATVLTIGLAAVAVTVAATLLLAAHRWRSGRTRPPAPSATATRPPQATPGPLVIRPTRLVVVGELRPSTGLRQIEPARGAARPTDRRRLLLRDASMLLFVAAIALFGLQALPAALVGGSGGVLSATATPGAAAAPPATTAGPTATAGEPAATTPGQTGAPNPMPATSESPASVPPAPTSSGTVSPDRLALLEPCPDRAGCYHYVVKRGDTLNRISRFFGVPLDTILRLNPQITDPSLILPGDRIELPTPTR